MIKRDRPDPRSAAVDLDAAIDAHPAPGWRLAASMIVALTLVAGAWIATAQVDRIAVAEGVVAPLGQTRTLQHLEGGVVVEILAREGDRVAAGSPILRLDLGDAGLNPEEIRLSIDALVLERARLLAEASQLDLALPTAERDRNPALAEAERATFRSRRREYESNQTLLQDRVVQRELDVESIDGRLRAARAQLEPLSEQFEIARALADQQLAPETAALRLAQEVEGLRGQIEDFETALPLAQAALAEARGRRLFERNRFRREAAERLREVEQEILRLRERYARATNQLDRATVTSPIDGVLNELLVTTVGGVVRPGAPIGTIVPLDEELIVEARLAPTDIGHVEAGMPATLKFETYDFMTYGVLDGAVTQIAADATRDDQGGHYFRITVSTDADRLSVGQDAYPISPGMRATVEVRLGRRPIWRYLLEPILKLREEAFREL